MINSSLQKIDPVLYSIITNEQTRQEHEINLIASENYASMAIMQATGSVLTNKYAEGYPGKRYYGGCQFVDEAETLAIERCKELFDAEHVNVQPHAGSPANMAVYFSVLNPGDTLMGMSLSEGGHLTHGHGVNFSGRFFKSIQYGVNKETEQLDYDAIEQLALEHKPKLLVVGASAYSRTINFERFGSIAKKCGAYLMADIAHIAGLIAAKLHPNPFPHADFVTSTTHKTLRGPRGGLIMCKKEFAQQIDKTIIPGVQGGPFMNLIAAKAVAFHEALQPEFTQYQQHVIYNARAMAQEFIARGYRIVTGGTDNHLFIVDLSSKGITGRAAELLLEKIGITVSRSTIPFDKEKPWITSGIRIGSPAISTRGIKEHEAKVIVALIDEALMNHDNEQSLLKIKEQTKQLARQFPIY
ncbi:MAG: serine hydroxymethyltransferase [Candidatus Dependentiae bacterium]|nr:serine hydroxymethyltransferase [Candidatus Dependentiae bacterium]